MSAQRVLAGVTRSSLYCWPAGPSALELVLKHRIDELCTTFRFCVSRRMTMDSRQEGHAANRKGIQGYMRQTGIWELGKTLAIDFVLAPMGQAVRRATSEICNNDRGSLFTSPQWAALLQQAHVRPRMDGKGRALPNRFVERPWHSTEYGQVCLHYASQREARRGLARYSGCQNHERSH